MIVTLWGLLRICVLVGLFCFIMNGIRDNLSVLSNGGGIYLLLRIDVYSESGLFYEGRFEREG